MEDTFGHQGDGGGRTQQEEVVAEEEEDPREQQRQQHPRAEITQIKALLRRNLLVRVGEAWSALLVPVSAICQKHGGFESNAAVGEIKVTAVRSWASTQGRCKQQQ